TFASTNKLEHSIVYLSGAYPIQYINVMKQRCIVINMVDADESKPVPDAIPDDLAAMLSNQNADILKEIDRYVSHLIISKQNTKLNCQKCSWEGSRETLQMSEWRIKCPECGDTIADARA
ncbi:MAG: hypothetical protein ABEI52_05850, partial [Halobacteriaceae archaeon]